MFSWLFPTSEIKVFLDKHEDGRINTMIIQKGDRESAKITYIYDADKNIRQLNIERGDIPLSTILEVLNARFIDRIGRIEDIELIKEVRLVQDKGAIDGTDIDITAFATVAGPGGQLILSYTVPANKTLLVYDWSGCMSDGIEEICGFLYVTPAAVYLGVGGGVRGFQTPFSKPKRVTTGNTAKIQLNHSVAGNRELQAHLGGILI